MSLRVVKQSLAEVPDRMLEGGEQALLELADLVLGTAQVNVRVDTGSLRDSGRKERGATGPLTRVIRVRFGGYVVNPKTGKLVDYARIIEERYPYLRPAWLQHRGQAEAIIRRMVQAQLKQVEVAGVLRFPR